MEVKLLTKAMTDAVDTIGQSPNGYNVTAAADAFWGVDRAANDNEVASQHDLGALGHAVRQSNLPRLVDALPRNAPRGKFLLDTSVWRRVPMLADFALNGPLPEIASMLLEAPSLRFYDDQMFVKEPGAVDRAAFHQDVPYFHVNGETGCVFWIPLDVVREGGGRIGYIPGSHRWERLYKPNIFVSEMPFPDSEGIDMPRIDANPEAYGVQYIDADPGDILVHHFLTVHGSEGNQSPNRRRAFSLRYCDATIRYRHRQGAPAQPLHRQDMTDGDALDDAIHPPVWPRY
jgi:ectoine hydroxylase-related dioxygenase (phytanoyl-CoA dioxygenase family)